MPLAWSYARTSTAKQAAAERSGMERQEQALKQWLRDHPEFELAEALVDAGVSAGKGKHRKRGALSRFLEMGRSGTIPAGSCLVVESVSRFTREASTDSLMSLIGGIFVPGLAIAFVNYDGGNVIDGSRWNRDAGLKFGLMAAADSARVEWEERASRSQGAARKRESLQDEGLRPDGRTPFWIARDPETGRLARDVAGGLVLDQHYAQALRRAVELVLAGNGMTRTAEQLNADAFSPPPTRARNQWVDLLPEHRRGWTPGVLSSHLRSPALVGTLCRKVGDLPGYYPQLIDHATFTQLRQVIEKRDTLRAAGRGHSHRARNLFQGLSRCAVCEGPVSFQKAAAHARPNHPGYVGCAAAAKKVCSNRGTIRADAWHDHCLTRLSQSLWEQLLPQPNAKDDVRTLRQAVDARRASRDLLKDQLKAVEERADKAWLTADEERTATIERAIKKVRQELKAEEEGLAAAQRELDVAMAKPRIEEQAAQFRKLVKEFWEQIDDAPGSDRVSFNRWLLSQEPAIQFLVHPAKPGTNGRGVELVVGGVSAGTEPLAPVARRMARAAGVPEPYAKDFCTSQGKSGVIAWQEPLAPHELAAWPNTSCEEL